MEARKFCGECGTKVILACPEYASENLPSERFCSACGQKLGKEEIPGRKEPSLEGERKHVTVLFSEQLEFHLPLILKSRELVYFILPFSPNRS